MPKSLWSADWYVYDFLADEFLVYIARAGKRRPNNPEYVLSRWSSQLHLAKPYSDPFRAKSAAARLNEQSASGFRVKPYGVVTAEAARCLYLINKRRVKNRGRENH